METIDYEQARRMVADALARAAAEYGRPICAAACDAQGFLLAFARADGAPVRSIALSQGKAYSAARMGVGTDAFLARLHRENIPASYFCDPALTALPGGAVVKNAAGRLLGAVGISGLAPEEDQAIADLLAASLDTH
ncbi:GlcG/HbpS family heme-binding protein [Ancylobacter mangrovi]|uniref:GlcG/HbpS family heme-binding protein n=1 Tax=Ancylobacter mangrovi TaxID=2972472 RepID=UPI002162BF79|nr:heme-binding protein [Ancylobacter mangrovi]MCS0503229.1 heme-binding protein [Ancylobacter mangrovi]